MFSAEEMPRLSELVRDKSASKKRDREENARTPATAPPQQMPVTPASSGTEKTGAPKEKGVALKEPVSPQPTEAHGPLWGQRQRETGGDSFPEEAQAYARARPHANGSPQANFLKTRG